MKIKLIAKLLLAAMAVLPATQAMSETRVTYKSAKSTSSYYQMAVQIAEGMKAGSNGDINVTVEDSQGSVQNVMEVIGRKGNYVFTTPPVLIKLARGGKAMFKDKANPRFDEIRALFPIPSLTMHFVMSEKSGVTDLAAWKAKPSCLARDHLAPAKERNISSYLALKERSRLPRLNCRMRFQR